MASDVSRGRYVPGLVYRHISARKMAVGVLEVAGKVVRVRVFQRPHRRGQRGQVRGFSQASKRRLVVTAAAIDWGALPGVAYLITLTYPGKEAPEFVPTDGRVARRHLKAFHERLRRWDKLAAAPAGLWKLESQRRGAVHYHVFVKLAGPSLVEVRGWVAKAWWEVVGSGSLDHLRAGTNAKRWGEQKDRWEGADPSLVGLYFAKYAAKWGGKAYQNEMPTGGGWGRWWGTWGVRVKWEQHPVEAREVVQLQRAFRRYQRRGAAKGRRYSKRHVVGRGDVARRMLDLYRGNRAEWDRGQQEGGSRGEG